MKQQYIGIFELENGDYYYVMKTTTTPDDVKLEAGASTNTGFYSCFQIEYDDDDSLDGNLERLYDEIIERKTEEDDIKELLKEY